jgi:hypothetical protein
MMIKNFQKGIATYKCHRCGKKTRETGGNESAYDLCRKCLDLTEAEEK